MPVIEHDDLSDIAVCDIVNELLPATEKEQTQKVTIGITFLLDDEAAGEEWG